MPDLYNYWFRKSRMTRRRLIGGTATAGLEAAALGLVGCGDDDDDDSGGSPTAAPTTASGGSPTAAASASAVDKQKGGTAHFISANNTFDTFDIDRSRFSPIAVLFGYTNLGFIAVAVLQGRQDRGRAGRESRAAGQADQALQLVFIR